MSQALLLSDPVPTVSVHDGRPATTSLEVAKFFGKRHDHVMRGIKDIIDNCAESLSAPNFGAANCPESFSRLNFELASYLDEQAKNRPMYIIYRDGFMLLSWAIRARRPSRSSWRTLRRSTRWRRSLPGAAALPWPPTRSRAQSRNAAGSCGRLTICMPGSGMTLNTSRTGLWK